jgi:hypothetical protein
MSEYQYYEFRAVDRPLSQTEQGELRRVSSRARISAAGLSIITTSATSGAIPTG